MRSTTLPSPAHDAPLLGLPGWAPGVFSVKRRKTGSEQNVTHRCVLMGAGGVLSRYLVKTHHRKNDILGLTELDGASQRSQTKKGPGAEISLFTVWVSFHYASRWLRLFHQSVHFTLCLLSISPRGLEEPGNGNQRRKRERRQACSSVKKCSTTSLKEKAF